MSDGSVDHSGFVPVSILNIENIHATVQVEEFIRCD